MNGAGEGWARVLALLVAELKALVRDRGALASLLGVLLLVGAAGPGSVILREKLATPPVEEQAADGPAFDCEAGKMPPVAAAGVVPAWLAWPDPFVAEGDADVLLRFVPGAADERDVVDLVVLVSDARKSSVRACLDARLRDERRTRLAALGISEAPESVVTARTLPPAPLPAEPVEAPPVGVAILSGLALLLSSVFLELGPRARAAGWLETWLTLPGPRWHLVAAWWLLGVVVATAGTFVMLAGDALATAFTGIQSGGLPWALLPVVVLGTSAVGVRAFLDVPDTRTAMTKAVPVLLLLGGSVVGARILEEKVPGLGGLVPFGGLALAIGGATAGPVLAAVTTLLASAALLLDGARALDRILVRVGALGRSAARRARGDYVPEVILLALVAMAGTGTWAPPELLLADTAARTALSMALFLALPALLVSIPLDLDRTSLLSWRAPPVHAWALLPLLVAGTLTLGGLLWRFGVHLFPSKEILAAYADTLGQFDGVFGLVAVSVVPGICEELLFRGALLGLLRRRFPTWAAVVLQAVAFALLHALAVRLPYTFALGVVFGVLVVRSGSLWPAIVAHAAHNFLATQMPEEGFEAWLDHPAAYVVAVLTPAVAWLAARRARPGT